MATTIRDVAKMAGTSVSAVSAVLNGKGRSNIRVSETTRERIREAAQQLGFTPNPLAQSLVTRRTGVLGLVFPYSAAFVDRNPFCAQIMSGVFEEVVREKYNIMLHTAIGDDWNTTSDTALIDPRVDGLILVIPTPNSPIVERCRRERFPFVTLVHEPISDDVCAINADELAGGRIATEHLIALGHRRIAHLTGDVGVASAEPRKQGFTAAMEAAGLQPELIPAGFAAVDGYKAMTRLLDKPGRELPTAIFAANDVCAQAAMTAMRERGLRIPGDIAVVGYDDTWFATMTQPPLTSVHMPITEMGVLATETLIALVEGREVRNRQPVLPVSLTVRGSCGAKTPN